MTDLLRQLIAAPSHSREEDSSALILFEFLTSQEACPRRFRNNVYAVAPGYTPSRPTLLLNSHHDTVKPAPSYTRNPYSPDIEGDRLYGLGSNDAGASVVALTDTFLALRSAPLPFNLILALTAEEEVGGENGMRAFLPHISAEGYCIDAAIVGEPTGLQPAVAERGLIVLDALTSGVTGHAARGEGQNAIYRAIADIESVLSFSPPVVSDILGPIGVNVTQINAGRQHNVVPDECRWVVDVRTTDAYTNEQTAEMLQAVVSPHTALSPRSTRVRASVIPESHPLVVACMNLGRKPFVSPTTSDMSLMYDFPSLKIGPGLSSRSHSADEYVLLSEIAEGSQFYKYLLLNITLL